MYNNFRISSFTQIVLYPYISDAHVLLYIYQVWCITAVIQLKTGTCESGKRVRDKNVAIAFLLIIKTGLGESALVVPVLSLVSSGEEGPGGGSTVLSNNHHYHHHHRRPE